MPMTNLRELLRVEVVVRKKLCIGGCACPKVMQRTNACVKFVQNEGSARGSYNESLRVFCR